ncbi:MAG: hypothetical protein ACJA0H_000671 [Francisellaceae bacterium]|jgi:hypothetical protein
MFISTFNNYLERIDPFYTQRLVFRKGLYISILILLFYLIFRPQQAFAFIIAPYLTFFVFELPIFNTYRKKYTALIFGYVSAIIFTSIFILLAPYKFILFIVGIVCFITYVYLCIKYYESFKMLVIPFFLVSVAFITSEPIGTLFALKGVVFALLLSLGVIILGYKTHQNLYTEIWFRAFKLSSKKIQKNLEYLLNDKHIYYDSKVMLSVNTMFEYKYLYRTPKLLNLIRLSVSVRDLNMLVIFMRDVDFNKAYWQIFYNLFSQFIEHVDNKEPSTIGHMVNEKLFPQNVHQQIGVKFLLKVDRNWNRLCASV